MNNGSNEVKSGEPGVLRWWWIVGVAGLLFGFRMSALAYFQAPWALYVWTGGLPVAILYRPALLAVVAGLLLAAAFIAAVGVTMMVCDGVRFAIARMGPSAAATTCGRVKS